MRPVAHPGLSVTVIVPCFNAEATVGEAVESALVQPHLDRVMVVDDGSTDGSLAVIRGFEPRVTILAGPNRGVSHARNMAAAETASEWLVFLDADDLLTPDTLQHRLSIAADADVVVCRWTEFAGAADVPVRATGRGVDRLAIQSDAELATATDVWAPPAALLYRRALFGRVGGFRSDLEITQDARFLFDCAFNGARFAFADEVGALYRLTPDSLSRRTPAAFHRNVLTNALQVEALWRARGTLTPAREVAVGAIVDGAARGLLACGDQRFLAAMSERGRFGAATPRLRAAGAVARALGVPTTRRLLNLAGLL